MSRLKGKPFEILAVSLDDTTAEVVGVVEALEFPGLHTWDEKGRENPVAKQYNVQNLPTWYLIDSKGVIRARDPFGEKLVPAIETVVGPINEASTYGAAVINP